jgi:signal transduction histidine kinase
MSDVKGIVDLDAMLKELSRVKDAHHHIFEFEYKEPNGRTIPYEVFAKLINRDDNPLVMCTAHTIFNSKEVENRILSAVIETEENERSRFAKDLHDGLGPLLSTIKLYVHELDEDDVDEEERRSYIKYVIELIDEAVSNTRAISNNITPQIISSYGLVKSIESFCNKVNITQKLNIDFVHEDIPGSLDKSIELTLFRIIIEMINNTIKHAFAENIELKLYTKASKLYLEYKDDGVGFELDKALKKGSSGIGLTNIINRVKSMSGNIHFNEALEKGIDIRFSIDIKS